MTQKRWSGALAAVVVAAACALAGPAAPAAAGTTKKIYQSADSELASAATGSSGVLTIAENIAPPQTWPRKYRYRQWDGKKWRTLPHPPIPQGTVVTGTWLTAGPGKTVWARTQVYRDAGESWSVARWDGAKWDAYPRFNGWPIVNEIKTSPGRTWVLGYDQGRPHLVYTDGKRWREIKQNNRWFVSSLNVLSNTNLWLAGDNTRISHYDGKRWTTLKRPKITLSEDQTAQLERLDVRSGKELWASYLVVDTMPLYLTTRRWNGRKWTNVKLPKGFTYEGILGFDTKGRTWFRGTSTRALAFYKAGRFTRYPISVKGTGLGVLMRPSGENFYLTDTLPSWPEGKPHGTVIYSFKR